MTDFANDHEGGQATARIVRLTQLYKALSEINQTIVRMSDEAELFPIVCRIAVEYGGVRMAWIGRYDAESERLIPVEAYGEGTDYLESIVISVSPSVPEGRGPSATAFRENRPVIINHFRTNPMTRPWLAQASRYGWGSSGAFSIQRGGKPYATISVYHAVEDFFDEETIKLLDEMTVDISFALDNFDRERERAAALEAVQASEEHFRAYFERSMVGMAATLPDRSWMEVNDSLCKMLGYSREELARLTWASLTHPDDLQGNEALFLRLVAGEMEEYAFDKRFIRKDGSILYAHLAARAVRNDDRSLAYVVALLEDVTLRKQAEARDRVRAHMLEYLARGAAAGEIMLRLIQELEAEDTDIHCSIVLLDEEATRLVHVVAPGLPAFYTEALSGLRIAGDTEECGTTAYVRQRTFIEDIAKDARWHEPYRSLALRARLAAVWSEPIRGSSGEVFGTFAFYRQTPGLPSAHQGALLENAANLLGIAIERRLAEEERHLASLIYQGSSEAVLVTDKDNRVTAINPAFTRMTGYELEEIRGENPGLLQSGRHDSGFYRQMWQEIRQQGFWQGEIWNRRKNGEIFPEWLTINTIRDQAGEVLRYVSLGSDITDKVRSDELIWRQANFDFLTGLPNRYMFNDRLEQEIRKAHREQSVLALLFIDLDRFKEVNDTLGHPVGDKLLIETAERINACVRESDTVARLGGDEFIVMLTQLADASDAEKIAQHILGSLARPFVFSGDATYITASIGITLYPEDSTGSEQLLRNADQAMYAAKNAGRNRLSYFTPALQESALQRLRLINDLRSAQSRQKLELYFQPIIELANRRVFKAEALLRWRHPERDMVSPAEFIPLAEETGLIVDIGDWVFREAALWARRWQGMSGEGLRIAVNISPVQFQSETLRIADWLHYLQELGLPANQISIEITEGLLLNAHPQVREKLLGFRDAGINVAIDDFGTGYSSLAYLKRFDIDFLKIDKSFIGNLDTDANDFALAEAIVSMAHKLGLKVVAEGVETEAQSRLLMDIGCDYAQGFLFSRALPADEFERFLSR